MQGSFMFTTYVLYSALFDKFYFGYTGDDVATRLAKHLANHGGLTTKAKHWRVVYTQTFETKTKAMAKEKEMKNKDKKKLPSAEAFHKD